MKTKDKLGEEIRSIRKKLDLTQKELSLKLRVSHIYLSYLEQGKKSPSKEFLEDLFRLIGVEKVPDKVLNMLSEAKIELKRRKQVYFSTGNNVYLMEEHGVFDQKSIRRMLEKDPQNLNLINAMIVLLLKQRKQKDAEQFLLDALKNINRSEDRKWLQAVYNRLNGEYEFAIQIMQRAVEEFDSNNDWEFEQNLKSKKAHFLFQLACLYFDFAQYLYIEKKDYSSSIINFELSLDYHQKIRQIDLNPSYQMDYASIYFWLAFLEKNPGENWLNYIREAKDALKLNLYEGVNNFPSKSWNSVYSKPYIVSTLSFIGRSYAEVALLESKNELKKLYLREGEYYFISSVPLVIQPMMIEYYRFYFNMSCFYSIKAEIQHSFSEDYQKSLSLSLKALLEAERSDSINNSRLMIGELNAKEGLSFFKQNCKKEFNDILGNLKRRSK